MLRNLFSHSQQLNLKNAEQNTDRATVTLQSSDDGRITQPIGSRNTVAMKFLQPHFCPPSCHVTPAIAFPPPKPPRSILPFSSRTTQTRQPLGSSITCSSPSRPNQTRPAPQQKPTSTEEVGIPVDFVKTLAKFKSRHNYIRVLEVSRSADHPFRGSRLLLLDGPGNIHSVNFIYKTLTDTYFDVFATLPPIIPPGPIGILGFGAGSAAKLILELYPDQVIHGWELDPSVIDVGREYFELSKLEKEHSDKLNIYIGNALNANLRQGFSGILVDLFCKGNLIPELQDRSTWERLKTKLRVGGRIMVNVGGSCVESEDSKKDGRLLMEDSLRAMWEVFGKDVGEDIHVLSFGNKKDESSIALTGPQPDFDTWKKALPRSLKFYADMWAPYRP